LKGFRVQDHYGHAPQDHGPEKDGQLPKIINGTDSNGTVTPDLDRSGMKGHRAAEDHTRSGLLDDGDCAVVSIVKDFFWKPKPKEILENLGKNLKKKRWPRRRSTAAGGKVQLRREKIYRPREKYMETLLPKTFIGGALAAAEREKVNLLHLRRQVCKVQVFGVLPEAVFHAKTG